MERRKGVEIMRNDLAIVWLPHFMTGCFRVAVNKQQGKESNYIIICCSPEYNGIWKWKTEDKKHFTKWTNNGTVCYCIPMEYCEKIQELEDIKNPELRREVRKNQENFCKKFRKSTNQTWILKDD